MNFDAYHKWLGIPPEEQPPNYYRLLGIKLFEADPDVISNAADRQMTHVRAFQAGQHSATSQQILNAISAARVCLLNAGKRSAYDAELRKTLAATAAQTPLPVAPPPVPARIEKRKFSPGTLVAVGAGVLCVLGLILFLATGSGPEKVATVEPVQSPGASSPVQGEQPQPTTAPNAVPEKAKEPPPSPQTSKPEKNSAAPSEAAKPGKETTPPSAEKSPPRAATSSEASQRKIEPGESKIESNRTAGQETPAKPVEEVTASAKPATAEPAMAPASAAAPATPEELANDAVLVFSFEEESFVRRDGKLYIKDLSGHDNDGLVKEAKLVEGRVGRGLLFSTDQSYVECADSASLNPQCVTVCAWINSQSRQTVIEDIVAKLDWTGPRGYSLRTNAQAKVRCQMGSPPAWCGAAADIAIEEQRWHHAAFTYDGKTAIVYVDGVNHGSSTIDHPIAPSQKGLFIGGGKYEDGAVYERFDGTIDEVAVFSRALTDKEIQAVYQLGLKGEHLIAVPRAEPEKAMPEPAPAKEGPLDPRSLLPSLKKKLRGRVAYDPKTGLFSLSYDWNSKAQLQDFDLSKAKLAYMRGRLSLQGGESIRHTVDFNEVAIEAIALVPQMKGKLIETTGGAVFFLGGAGSDRMYLSTGRRRDRIEAVVPKNQRTGLQPVLVTAAANRLAFAYGAGKPTQLGKAVDNFHAGQVELLGGDVGYQFGKLVLTGKINEDWLKSNLEERAAETPAKEAARH